MPFNIIRNDIVRMEVDAIVNAANPKLLEGGGVCGRIYRAAGSVDMTAACRAIGSCPAGSAAITPGFKLPAKYVIHTVGPVWNGGDHGEEEVLRSAYRSSLELATRHSLESIAFPLISSGIYGYPYEEALAVALDEINRYLFEHDLQVTLVMYDSTATMLGFKLRKDLKSFIDDHYVAEYQAGIHYLYSPLPQSCDREVLEDIPVLPLKKDSGVSMRDRIYNSQEKTFSQALLNYVDAKGMTDVEAYRGSNLDRRLFSKIRSNDYYTPSKSTVLAFTIGLKLSIAEANDLLARAGFAFSPCDVRDLIVRFFLEQGDYDIARVNGALYDFDQALLGV